MFLYEYWAVFKYLKQMNDKQCLDCIQKHFIIIFEGHMLLFTSFIYEDLILLCFNDKFLFINFINMCFRLCYS